MSENWKKKEEYYFDNINEKRHLIRTETGTIDLDDRNKMKHYKNLDSEERSFLEKELIRLDEDRELMISSTPSDDDMSNLMNRRYNQFNKASYRGDNVTSSSTNGKSRMQDDHTHRKFGNSRDQSIMMASTVDHDMGQNDKSSKESQHKPKSAEDLKYFTGLLTTLI